MSVMPISNACPAVPRRLTFRGAVPVLVLKFQRPAINSFSAKAAKSAGLNVAAAAVADVASLEPLVAAAEAALAALVSEVDAALAEFAASVTGVASADAEADAFVFELAALLPESAAAFLCALAVLRNDNEKRYGNRARDEDSGLAAWRAFKVVIKQQT